MICKKQEIITKKYTYMDLQKISKNNHHVFKKKHFQEHNVVCQICDDLGWINYIYQMECLNGIIVWINYNYQMECLYGIIGKNNANNKKINSFEKS